MFAPKNYFVEDSNQHLTFKLGFDHCFVLSREFFSEKEPFFETGNVFGIVYDVVTVTTLKYSA
jgi:hypothetical protein